MNTLEAISLLGTFGYIDADDLMIKVIIKNVRNVWGEDQYLVSPVGGRGEKWIKAYRFSAEV